MAQALYAKNNALCARNGSLIVGTAAAEPPCVCGGGGEPPVVNQCCPDTGGWLPPLFGPPFFRWGPLTVAASYSWSRLTLIDDGGGGGGGGGRPGRAIQEFLETREWTYNVPMTNLIFNGPASNGTNLQCPSFVAPVNPPEQWNENPRVVETQRTTLDGVLLSENVVSGSFGFTFRNEVLVPGGPREQFVSSNVSGTILWGKTSSRYDYRTGPPGAQVSSSASLLGPTLTAQASYYFSFGGVTETEQINISISGLRPCVRPGAASSPGCSNCTDNLTGGAIL
jgi:hypothetical protein